MNRKGMTIIELVVSFSLASVIALFLIEIVIFLKDTYAVNAVKSEMIMKQSLISDRLNTLFENKEILLISDACGINCREITFNDETMTTINFDVSSNKVIIDDYIVSLPNGSRIEDVMFFIKTIDAEIENNGIFSITASITNDLIENEKYNINKVYLFNKNENNLNDTGIYTFDYTGVEQSFNVPIDGYYKIELWGAQGGGSTSKGAYTSGIIELKKNEILYIYVGQAGSTTANITNFNGGTSNQGGYNGGGATDIRLVNGAWNNAEGLKSRIMVAAGSGSGTGNSNTTLGAGGTLVGNAGGGTSGGTQKTYGAVQSTSYTVSSFGIANGGCSGGNGYYPGGGASCANGAGGGSSFISGYAGVNAITSSTSLTATNNTIHYSKKYFIDGEMTGGVNSGNGHAKITFLSKSKPIRINNKLDSVRYIKDCVNGSSANTGDHWVEVQAIKNGVNVALNKSVTTTGTVNSSYPLSRITDGDITSSNYAEAALGTLSCITVDLGSTYELDEIAVWHYWSDGRTYYDNVTSVSNDNKNWTEVINKSAVETANGKRVSAH